VYLCPRDKLDPPASIRVSRVTAALSELSCTPLCKVAESTEVDGTDKSEEDATREGEMLYRPAERKASLSIASSC
jgi:hypothetical protein